MGKFKYCSSRTTIGRILLRIRYCTKELKYHQEREQGIITIIKLQIVGYLKLTRRYTIYMR